MYPDKRSLVGSGIDTATNIEKSPLAEGFVAGLKAALIGAPIGAAVQGMRGKDALHGALVAALVPGLLAAIARGSKKKLENLNAEAAIRYHAGNIRDREPLFFMPPKQYLGQYFTRRGE